MTLNNSLELSHEYVRKTAKPGDSVVDATAGKGRDTLFLSNLVGSEGRVYAFDIQKQAIEATKKLLDEQGASNVFLIREGHEKIGEHVEQGISCVMFNLGYLPGSDHSIQTKADTTIIAITESLRLISRGGIVTIVIYQGGDTGYSERDRVAGFCSELDQHEFTVMQTRFTNQKNDPPIFICIEKN